MRTSLFTILTLALFASGPASAAEKSCADLDWPVSWEQAALAKPDLAEIASGSVLRAEAAEAFVLRLEPASNVKLAAEPSGKSKATAIELYAGTVTIDGGAGPGTIFVTISSDGWIDVMQDGRTLASIAHTGSKDCPGVRKSVQFDVANDSFVVQVTGVPGDRLRASIRRAD